MKHILLFSALVLFMKIALCQSNITSEEKECNFIVDYYPMVYKAQLKYLEKDLDSAFYYLDKAKNKCGLLNTPDIVERMIYAEMNVERQDYKNALESLKEIVLVGFPFEYLEYNESFEELKETQEWKKLKKLSIEVNDRGNDFFNWELRNEILAMLKSDQEVRHGDTLDYERMKKVDDSHQKRIKEIFETYGYPNEKLIGYSNKNENVDISLMLMHFDDLEYFKPKLLDFIKRGECTPYVLAYMVDSNDRKDSMYTYGIYSTVDSTEIKDFSNLDSKRKSIGLRSLEDHNRTISLIMKKYKN